MTDQEGKFSEEEALEKAFGDVLSGKAEAKKEPPAAVSSTDKKIKPEEPKEPKEKTVTIKEAEYQKLLKEISDAKDRYLRLFAEFENVKKRTEREKAEFIKYANAELLTQFLAILDDLERSVEVAKTKHEDYDAFLKGIELVMAHVYEVLKKNDVKPIEAVGKKFDPHIHEPLMQEETDKASEGTIVEEFQKRYMLGDKVIRTTKVKVAMAIQKTEDRKQKTEDKK